MSRPIHFQRPVEFDPTLAHTHAQAHSHTDSQSKNSRDSPNKGNSSSPQINKKEKLKDDFGFDSDVEIDLSPVASDEEGEIQGGEEETLAISGKSHKSVSVLSNSATPLKAHKPSHNSLDDSEEFDRIMQTVRLAQEGKLKAEQQARLAEEKFEESQRLNDQAKKILIAKFKEQIRALNKQLEAATDSRNQNAAGQHGISTDEHEDEQAPAHAAAEPIAVPVPVSSESADLRLVEIRHENRDLKFANKELKTSNENLNKNIEELQLKYNNEIKTNQNLQLKINSHMAQAAAAAANAQANQIGQNNNIPPSTPRASTILLNNSPPSQQPITTPRSSIIVNNSINTNTNNNNSSASASAQSSLLEENSQLKTQLKSLESQKLSQIQSLESELKLIKDNSNYEINKLNKSIEILKYGNNELNKNIKEYELKLNELNEMNKKNQQENNEKSIENEKNMNQNNFNNNNNEKELNELKSSYNLLNNESQTYNIFIQHINQSFTKLLNKQININPNNNSTKNNNNSTSNTVDELLAFITGHYKENEKILENSHKESNELLTKKIELLENSTGEANKALRKQIDALESANKELSAQLNENELKSNEYRRHINEMNELIKEKDLEILSIKEKVKEKLTIASDGIKKLKFEYSALKAQYINIKNNYNSMKSFINTRAIKEIQLIRAAQCQVRAECDEFINNGISNNQSIESLLMKEIKSLQSKSGKELELLNGLYKKEMQLRKNYFNEIQELKGNIRCYLRIRPLSNRELDEKLNCIDISSEDQNKLSISNPEKRNIKNEFEFEKIFQPESTQEQVFSEIGDLVVSVMDGYHTSIFAYGQTGTGKTFTMEGPKENPGVNLRTMEKLFQTQSDRQLEVDYSIQISLLEIYNEKIQDLLNLQGKQVLKVQSGQQGMEVADLTMVPVQNSEQVLETLKIGQKNRKVVATAMNDASSRSHLVLTVYVKGKNKFTSKETSSKLNLIDLAGSERVDRSNVTGDAMKEAIAINSSLSALGNVIAARANKQAHVPYRDSVLTWLLKDSLEKNSKTLMIIQVSPNSSDAGESICSLRFGERVRRVELGQAGRRDSKGENSTSGPVKK